MASILVTGGAGFIGSHLCERLIKDKKFDRISVVDNLDPVYPKELKQKNLNLLTNSNRFKFYEVDIRDKIGLKKVFEYEKPDIVVHLAAKTDTRSSVNEPYEHISVNIEGTLNLLELSREFGTKKFVFISSSSIYGNTKAKPPFNEKISTDFPLAPYGATKKAGEVMAHTYHYNHGIDVACLRFFNVYGERMRSGLVISRWVDNILSGKPIEMSGNGRKKRDFTYVGDVVDAIIRVINRSKGYEIFNIASSKPATLTELLSLIERATKIKAEVKERESNKASIDISHADIRKAKKILEWSPKMTLKKGVSRYVDWFKKDRA